MKHNYHADYYSNHVCLAVLRLIDGDSINKVQPVLNGPALDYHEGAAANLRARFRSGSTLARRQGLSGCVATSMY